MIVLLSQAEHAKLLRDSARYQQMRQHPDVLAVYGAATGFQLERAIDQCIKAKHEEPYAYLQQPDSGE